MRADDLLGAEAIQRRHQRRVGESALERGRCLVEARGLRGDDADVERFQLVGVG